MVARRSAHEIASWKNAPFGDCEEAVCSKGEHENDTTWLIPKLVGEVKFTEWTSEGEMRHPAFLGVRTDKKALVVIREQAWILAQRRAAI